MAKGWVGCFLVLAGIIGAAQGALAAEYLYITQDEIRVYKRPSKKSGIITTLFKGDAVPVSKKSPKGFKKILLKDGNRKTIGYIRTKDLKAFKGKKRRSVRKRSKKRKSPFIVGLSGGLNYQSQGGREVSVDGSVASIGDLSGTSGMFGIFLDVPAIKRLYLRPYFELKTSVLSGQASYQPSGGSSFNPTDTYLEQSFMSLGVLAKYYFKGFWVGGGLQMDKGQKSTLTFGTAEPTELTENPNLFFGYAAVGMDFPISRKFVLMPDIRIGAIFNTTPMTTEIDGRLSIGYRL